MTCVSWYRFKQIKMFILGGPSATSFVYILLISKFWFMFTEEPIEEFVRSGIDLESLEMFLSF